MPRFDPQFFRMNFAAGIDERIGKYSKPGTLRRLRNMVLDIYNEGSIRNVWGASPVVLEEQHAARTPVAARTREDDSVESPPSISIDSTKILRHYLRRNIFDMFHAVL